MSPFTKIWNVFRRDRIDEELRAELDSHVALLEEDARAGGKTEAEAQADARSRFGSTLLYRERSVDSLVVRWLDDLWRDVRYAIRQLAASPGLAIVLMLTLGLGIGATVAIFSVVNAVLLRPLPYADANRIVIVWETLKSLNNGSASPGHFVDWTAQNTVFDETAALVGTTYNLAEAGEPERLNGSRVTPGYFRVAAVKPLLGRYFTEKDVESNNRLVVLSELLWRRRFGAEPAVIGHEIRLNGEPFTVTGIAPAEFVLSDGRRSVVGGFSGQLWTPLVFPPELRGNYGSHMYRVLAKLKAGVPRERAQEDLERITRDIALRHPLDMESRSVNVQSFRDALLGNAQIQSIVLLSAVGLVLLIGCVNVSSLLLARATARRKEMAVRAALGSGVPRIVRQLLTESVVLALGGGGVALAVAAIGVRFLIRTGPPEIPRLSAAGLDTTVLSFAAVLTVVTGVLFGLAPAIRMGRADLQTTLREGARGSSTAVGRDHLRGLLVVAEIAVSVVLIVGAGLFVRSAWRLQQIPLGFSTANVAMARIALPPARYSSDESVTEAYHAILERLRAQPAVLRAGASTGIPMNGGGTDVSLTIEGRTLSPGAMPAPQFHMVTDSYFETIGMPLHRGRYLDASDMRPGTPPVVVINQKAADTIWPGENPLGKRVSCCTLEMQWREVVGVVGDARSFGQFAPIQMEMFVPFTQAPPLGWTAFQRSMALVVRTSRIADAPNALRQSVKSVDPSLPVFAVQTLDQIVANSTDGRRFNMLLLSLLAATGLTLAAVGIYGVVVYFITQRTAEIGLRLALGATGGTVIRMVVRQATILATAGISGGIVAAIAGTRVLKSLLFEISPTDPPTYIGGGLVFLTVALIASVLPALRATRIDPVRSLGEF